MHTENSSRGAPTRTNWGVANLKRRVIHFRIEINVFIVVAWGRQGILFPIGEQRIGKLSSKADKPVHKMEVRVSLLDKSAKGNSRRAGRETIEEIGQTCKRTHCDMGEKSLA